MFHNIDPKTNGEERFYSKIKDSISVIFDVGSRFDSEFLGFEGEVHYFEPASEFIERLKAQPNKNRIAHFNNFGLGEENTDTYYYPAYQSFYNRTASCGYSDEKNKMLLTIKKASDYARDRSVKSIDFMKIDTEGYEFNVIKGFGDFIENVKLIQFEYGGTFLDNKTKLKDVIDYLAQRGFHNFSYLTQDGAVLIEDTKDHYHYCNIVCEQRGSNILNPSRV